MSEINYRPWVGNNALMQGYKGKRVLVLGESHYCKENLKQGEKCHPLCKKENFQSDCFSFTEDVMHDVVYNYSGKKYEQTFLCFERAVTGKELTQEEREEFWESVIFYNYMQYAQEGPGVAPKTEHWEKSENAFKELLEKYMPDLIIVWGVRLYSKMPNWNGEESELQFGENAKTKVWTYTVNGKNIPAFMVHHPCTPTGKNWGYWHDLYKDIFKQR